MKTNLFPIAIVLCLFAVSSAGASMVLVADGILDAEPRLTGLGHTVTQSDASTWDASFDYSPYDVVAFEFGSDDPADLQNLVTAVDASDVGVVFLRGGADVLATATALGLITGGSMHYQSPTDLNVIDNSHFITQNLSLGTHNLGYTYMSYFDSPGAGTTTLGNGPDGAALLVHNSRRVVGTPFFGHTSGYGNENATGLEMTDRSIEWAAIPEPATLNLLILGGLMLLRRRR